jgi:hypothetical protein
MNKIINTLGSRWFQFLLIPFAVLAWFIWTDPSEGADTLLRIQLWMQALIVTGLSYLVAKAMLGKASSEELYDMAARGVVSAGLAYFGVCLLRGLVLFSLLIFFALVQR